MTTLGSSHLNEGPLQIVEQEVLWIGETGPTRAIDVARDEHAEHGSDDVSVQTDVQHEQNADSHQCLLRCTDRAGLERETSADPSIDGDNNQYPCRCDQREVHREDAKPTEFIVGHVPIERNLAGQEPRARCR